MLLDAEERRHPAGFRETKDIYKIQGFQDLTNRLLLSLGRESRSAREDLAKQVRDLSAVNLEQQRQIETLLARVNVLEEKAAAGEVVEAASDLGVSIPGFGKLQLLKCHPHYEKHLTMFLLVSEVNRSQEFHPSIEFGNPPSSFWRRCWRSCCCWSTSSSRPPSSSLLQY